MIAEKDPYIKSAYQKLQIISQDKEKRLEYEACEKAIRDYRQGIFEAEQRGEQRGREEGIWIFILDNLEENVPKEKTIIKLQKFFNLAKEDAEQYFVDVQNQKKQI